MKILVTGGAGYIGSHTCMELLCAGYDVVVVDNLSNSKMESLKRVQKLTGKTLEFHLIDLLDQHALNNVFQKSKIDAVIHFAGLKAVGESVSAPLKYYHNNVVGTLVLCSVMNNNNVKNIVFSSSATVYGDPKKVPIREEFPVNPTNPYGRSKLMIEDILKDLFEADKNWNVVLLRYFNPVGAHPSGQIGEDPNGIPNNLFPYICQVAVGKLSELSVFGSNYPTPDGTGVRDYIHVVDLATAHISALSKFKSNFGIETYNIGTGRGYSVFEIISAFEKASGRKIPHKIIDRRPGDIATCFADPTKANKQLGWAAQYDINQMCADAWQWQEKNPNGY
ncbi:MAG: UDP-glucose 4-epimerase GalE [Deltaproteobacteria bacterium]|nr:UDP-glucose 4-epimerase GalE [Deltaproteobacteria bacterium]